MFARRSIALLAFCISLTWSYSMTQDCKGPNQLDEKSLYYRTFLFKGQDEGRAIQGDRSNHHNVYGRCRNFEKHTQKMLSFLESFGVDLSPIKENPFRAFETDVYSFKPYRQGYNSTYRVLMESFYEYAEFRNSPITFGSFGVTLKQDLDGPKGKIPAGTFILTGVYRFVVDGNEECLEYRWQFPENFVVSRSKYSVIILDMYHEMWGQGMARGLTTDMGNRIDGSMFVSFPPGKL